MNAAVAGPSVLPVGAENSIGLVAALAGVE